MIDMPLERLRSWVRRLRYIEGSRYHIDDRPMQTIVAEVRQDIEDAIEHRPGGPFYPVEREGLRLATAKERRLEARKEKTDS